MKKHLLFLIIPILFLSSCGKKSDPTPIDPPKRNEIEIVSNTADFQLGLWGDSQKTIEDLESGTGNSKYEGTIEVPKVTENNIGLTTITYKKAGEYDTYYFKSGKLYAGAFTYTVPYGSINTNLNGIFSLYFDNIAYISTKLGTSLIELKAWSIPSDQISTWDGSNTTRAQAVGLNYLMLKAEGSSPKGTGRVELSKPTPANVALHYILISPTQQ